MASSADILKKLRESVKRKTYGPAPDASNFTSYLDELRQFGASWERENERQKRLLVNRMKPQEMTQGAPRPVVARRNQLKPWEVEAKRENKKPGFDSPYAEQMREPSKFQFTPVQTGAMNYVRDLGLPYKDRIEPEGYPEPPTNPDVLAAIFPKERDKTIPTNQLTDKPFGGLGDFKTWFDQQTNALYRGQQQGVTADQFYDPMRDMLGAQLEAEKGISGDAAKPHLWNSIQATKEQFGQAMESFDILGQHFLKNEPEDTFPGHIYHKSGVGIDKTYGYKSPDDEKEYQEWLNSPESHGFADFNVKEKPVEPLTNAVMNLFGAGVSYAGAGAWAVSSAYPQLGEAMALLRAAGMQGVIKMSAIDDGMASTTNPGPYDLLEQYSTARAGVQQPMSEDEYEEALKIAAEYDKKSLPIENMSLYDIYGFLPYAMGQMSKENMERKGGQATTDFGLGFLNAADIAAAEYRTRLSPDVHKEVLDIKARLTELAGKDDLPSNSERTELVNRVNEIYEVVAQSDLLMNPEDRLKFQDEKLIDDPAEIAEKKKEAIELYKKGMDLMENAATPFDAENSRVMLAEAAYVYGEAMTLENEGWQQRIDEKNFANPWALGAMIITPSVFDIVDNMIEGTGLKPGARRLETTAGATGLSDMLANPEILEKTLDNLSEEVIRETASTLDTWTQRADSIKNTAAENAAAKINQGIDATMERGAAEGTTPTPKTYGPDDYIAGDEATWTVNDVDQPVVITGKAGTRDGVPFYTIEGSNTGVPGTQLTMTKAADRPGDIPVQTRVAPGDTAAGKLSQSAYNRAINDAYAIQRMLTSLLGDISYKEDVVKIIDAIITDPVKALRDGIAGPWVDKRLSAYAPDGTIRIPQSALRGTNIQDSLLTLAVIWDEFKNNSIVLAGKAGDAIDKNALFHEMFNANVLGGARRYGVATEWGYTPYGTQRAVVETMADGRGQVKFLDGDGAMLGVSNVMPLTSATKLAKDIGNQIKNGSYRLKSPVATTGSLMRGLVSPFYIFTVPGNIILNVINQTLYAFSDGINPFTREGGVLAPVSRNSHKDALFGASAVTGRQVSGGDSFTEFMTGGGYKVALPGSKYAGRNSKLNKLWSSFQFLKPAHAAQEIAFSDTIHYRNMVQALNNLLHKSEDKIVADLVGNGMDKAVAQELVEMIHEEVYANGTRNLPQFIDNYFSGASKPINLSKIDQNWKDYIPPAQRNALLERWSKATSPEELVQATNEVMLDIRKYWEGLASHETNVAGRSSWAAADAADDFRDLQANMARAKRMGVEGADETVKTVSDGIKAMNKSQKELIDLAMKTYEQAPQAMSSFISNLWYKLQSERIKVRQSLAEAARDVYEDATREAWTEKYFPRQMELWTEYYSNVGKWINDALEDIKSGKYKESTHASTLEEMYARVTQTSEQTLVDQLENMEPSIGKSSNIKDFLDSGRELEDLSTAQYFLTAQQLGVRPDVLIDISYSAMKDISSEGARIRGWLDSMIDDIKKAAKDKQPKMWDEYRTNRNRALREFYSTYVPSRWAAASIELVSENIKKVGKTAEQVFTEAQQIHADILLAARYANGVSDEEIDKIKQRIISNFGAAGIPTVNRLGRPFDTAVMNALRKTAKDVYGYTIPTTMRALYNLSPRWLMLGEEISKLYLARHKLATAQVAGTVSKTVADWMKKYGKVMNLTDDQATDLARIMEARARSWAEQTGLPVDEYVPRHFADPVSGGTPDPTALFETIDYSVPEWQDFFKKSQVKGDMSVRGTTPPGEMMRMFHGTGAGEYPAYDPRFDTGRNIYGRGHYMSESWDVTSGRFIPPEKQVVIKLTPDRPLANPAIARSVDYWLNDEQVSRTPLTIRNQFVTSRHEDMMDIVMKIIEDFDGAWETFTGYTPEERALPEAFGMRVDTEEVFNKFSEARKALEGSAWYGSMADMKAREFYYKNVQPAIDSFIQAANKYGSTVDFAGFMAENGYDDFVTKIPLKEGEVISSSAAIRMDTVPGMPYYNHGRATVDPSELQNPIVMENSGRLPTNTISRLRQFYEFAGVDWENSRAAWVIDQLGQSIGSRDISKPDVLALVNEVYDAYTIRLVANMFDDLNEAQRDTAARSLGFESYAKAQDVVAAEAEALGKSQMEDMGRVLDADTRAAYVDEAIDNFYEEINEIIDGLDNEIKFSIDYIKDKGIMDILGGDGFVYNYRDYGDIYGGYAGKKVGSGTMPYYVGTSNLFDINKVFTIDEVVEVLGKIKKHIDENPQPPFESSLLRISLPDEMIPDDIKALMAESRKGGSLMPLYDFLNSDEVMGYFRKIADEREDLIFDTPISNYTKFHTSFDEKTMSVYVEAEPASGVALYPGGFPSRVAAEDAIEFELEELKTLASQNGAIPLSSDPPIVYKDRRDGKWRVRFNIGIDRTQEIEARARTLFNQSYEEIMNDIKNGSPYDNEDIHGMMENSAWEVTQTEDEITGHGIWHYLSSKFGDLSRRYGIPADPNVWIESIGYDGITHIGGGGDLGGPHRVVIAFKPEDVKSVFNKAPTSDPRFLYDTAGDVKRGSIEFAEDGKAIIRALQSPDLVTAIHELGHAFRRDMYEMAKFSEEFAKSVQWLEDWAGVARGYLDEPPVPEGKTRLYHGSAAGGIYDGPAWFSTDRPYAQSYRGAGSELQYVDVDTKWLNEQADPMNYGQTPDKGFAFTIELDSDFTGVRNSLGTATSARWTREAEERFAKAFERYITNGRAPSKRLEPTFKRLRNWLKEIYLRLSGRGTVAVPTPLREMFDRILSFDEGDPEKIAAAQAEVKAAEDLLGKFKIADNGAIGTGPMGQAVLTNDMARATFGGSTAPGIMFSSREALERIDAFGKNVKENAAALIAGTGGKVDPITAAKNKQYLRKLRAYYGDLINTANQYGEKMAGFAMIDYNNLNRADEVMGLVQPYWTWYSRSFKNAAERMMFEPGWFAHLNRIQMNLQKQASANNDPDRFQGSIKVNTPWGDPLYVNLQPSKYYMLLPWAINNRFAQPQDMETPLGQLTEGLNANGLGVYWWWEKLAQAAEAQNSGTFEDFMRKEGRVWSWNNMFRGIQELAAFSGAAGGFDVLSLPNQAKKPYFENSVARSINNMRAKGEITQFEAGMALQMIKDSTTDGADYYELRTFIEENPEIRIIVNKAIKDAMSRDVTRTTTSMLFGVPMYPFDETENVWTSAADKRSMMYPDVNPVGTQAGVNQFYDTPEGELSQLAGMKASAYTNTSLKDPAITVLQDKMYNNIEGDRTMLNSAWQAGEDAISLSDPYALPVDRTSHARIEARKAAVAMYGEAWVAEFESKYGTEWYISDLTRESAQEVSSKFPSLGGVAEQPTYEDPTATSMADILRSGQGEDYSGLSEEEKRIKLKNDTIDYVMHMPGKPDYDQYEAMKGTSDNWYSDYEAANQKYEDAQIAELVKRLKISPEEARKLWERDKNFYKTPADLKYEATQEILSEVEGNRPAYDPDWPSDRKKQWYRDDQRWLYDSSILLAKAFGITPEEARDILLKRRDRRKELRDPDGEETKSSSYGGGRGYYGGGSWSRYSSRRSGYSRRSYGGSGYYSGGYYGGGGGYSNGGNGGESDLLPSIESYIGNRQRLTGALWSTPKTRYIN